jgi:hypothetical protein
VAFPMLKMRIMTTSYVRPVTQIASRLECQKSSHQQRSDNILSQRKWARSIVVGGRNCFVSRRTRCLANISGWKAEFVRPFFCKVTTKSRRRSRDPILVLQHNLIQLFWKEVTFIIYIKGGNKNVSLFLGSSFLLLFLLGLLLVEHNQQSHKDVDKIKEELQGVIDNVVLVVVLTIKDDHLRVKHNKQTEHCQSQIHANIKQHLTSQEDIHNGSPEKKRRQAWDDAGSEQNHSAVREQGSRREACEDDRSSHKCIKNDPTAILVSDRTKKNRKNLKSTHWLPASKLRVIFNKGPSEIPCKNAMASAIPKRLRCCWGLLAWWGVKANHKTAPIVAKTM